MVLCLKVSRLLKIQKTLSSSLSGWFGWCLHVVLLVVDSSRLLLWMSQKIFLEGTFPKKLKKRGGGEDRGVQHPKKRRTKNEPKKKYLKSHSKTTFVQKTKKGTRKGVSTTTTTPRHKKTLTLDDQRESLWSRAAYLGSIERQKPKLGLFFLTRRVFLRENARGVRVEPTVVLWCLFSK